MPRISFSYFVEDKIDPATAQVIGHFMRPYVSIRLSIHRQNPTNSVNALVDSGSDRNLFPKSWGDILGINFRKAKQVKIFGIGNHEIAAYTAKINIWIDKRKYQTEADFSPEQQTPLLGRQGFFNLFKEIIFEENKGYLHIEL